MLRHGRRDVDQCLRTHVFTISNTFCTHIYDIYVFVAMNARDTRCVRVLRCLLHDVSRRDILH